MSENEMPPWPGSDAPDNTGDLAELIQNALDGVVVGWVLIADVASGNGDRGLHMLSSAQTPYWIALGYLDATRLDIEENVRRAGDSDDDDEDEVESTG